MVSVYLGDLGYYNDYNFTQPTPLNVTYVGAYAKQFIPELDIEIFKNPLHFVQRLKENPPDIVALSNYQWNTNLNTYLVDLAKSLNPNLIAIFGGPNFNGVDPERATKFFVDHPRVDFYIEREGEATFRSLLENLIANDLDAGKLDSGDWPCTLFSYDHQSRTLINNTTGDFERLDLTAMPSPYLDGWMDPFLDDEYLAPIIETNRGCPYSCAFCAWGNATQSKVRQFPLDVVIEEIRYAARRAKNPNKLLYLADANFGILKRDEEIAKAIADCSDTVDYPKENYVYFAKNTNQQVLKVAELMRAVTSMSMSKQSINEDVLANIKRKNIPHQQYDELRIECEKRGVKTFTELIYGLPGEDYESFVDGVVKTVRQGASIAMYPLLLIGGAENDTTAHRKEFGLRSKFRVLPRFISTMPGLNTLEYEEVAIENDALSFAEWLRVREFHFTVQMLASDVFTDLKRELEAHDLDYATLARRMIDDAGNWPPEITELMAAYRAAAKAEFVDGDDLRRQFDAEEMKDIELKFPALNYYYQAKYAASEEYLEALRQYLLSTMSRFFATEVDQDAIEGLRVAVDLCFDRFISYENLQTRRTIEYRYDIDGWRAAVKPDSILTHALETPRQYDFEADARLQSRLNDLVDNGHSLTEAVYKLRSGFIGFRGDVVFSYQRAAASDQVKVA